MIERAKSYEHARVNKMSHHERASSWKFITESECVHALKFILNPDTKRSVPTHLIHRFGLTSK